MRVYERDGSTVLDAHGELTIARSDNHIAFDMREIQDIQSHLCFLNFTFYFMYGSNRLSRFLSVIPALWRFAK